MKLLKSEWKRNKKKWNETNWIRLFIPFYYTYRSLKNISLGASHFQSHSKVMHNIRCAVLYSSCQMKLNSGIMYGWTIDITSFSNRCSDFISKRISLNRTYSIYAVMAVVFYFESHWPFDHARTNRGILCVTLLRIFLHVLSNIETLNMQALRYRFQKSIRLLSDYLFIKLARNAQLIRWASTDKAATFKRGRWITLGLYRYIYRFRLKLTLIRYQSEAFCNHS